jgi:isoleucyl-tRNA synthetase
VTFKLLLGALGDFSPKDAVAYDQLQQVDRIALKHLSDMVVAIQKSYDNFEFYMSVNILKCCANLEFSAFYMEAIKDHLYTLEENSASHRAAQKTLFYIFTHLQEVPGPITPILVEETWEPTPEAVKIHSGHPLQRLVASPPAEWQDAALDTSHQEIAAVHLVIKNLQQQARSKKQLGSSLQSFVHISLPGDETSIFHRHLSELTDLFVVSSVTIGKSGESIPGNITDVEWQFEEECELPSGEQGIVQFIPPRHQCARDAGDMPFSRLTRLTRSVVAASLSWLSWRHEFLQQRLCNYMHVPWNCSIANPPLSGEIPQSKCTSIGNPIRLCSISKVLVD